MSQVKPSDFPLLLEVFRDGLEYGAVSRDEIVAWADQIIANESEPDYFFIDISMSRDINNLISILKATVPNTHNTISGRAILGVAYQKLFEGVINNNNVIVAINGVSYENLISFAEDNFLAALIYDHEMLFADGPFAADELRRNCLNVLSIYKDFQLNNYYQWVKINLEIERVLKPQEEKLQASRKASEKVWKKREARRKLKRYALIWGLPALVVLSIVLINYLVMQHEPAFLKSIDHHENLFFLDVFGFYFIVRWGYFLLTKKRKR